MAQYKVWGVSPREIDWSSVIYFLVVHLLGIFGIWYAVTTASDVIVWLAVLYFFVCHLSITIGAHRYYTHGAFKTYPVIEYIFVILFSGVAQSSMLWWVGMHLTHHEYEDIPGKDPHTPLDGFFHSHMGWLLLKSGCSMPSDKYIGKFTKKKNGGTQAILWQHAHQQLLMVLMTFMVPTALGLLAGDVLGGLLVIGFARVLLQYHFTWIVNSIGHTLGDRGDNFATNFGWYLYTPIAAIVTVGEAWHANHHKSSAHWRLGRKWWQIDVGAYVIWALSKVGLFYDLKEPANRKRVPSNR